MLNFFANEDIAPSRLLRCQPTFSSLLMMSVGVHWSALIFISSML